VAAETARPMQPGKPGQKLAAKELCQHREREEKVVLCLYPARAIERQAAGGDDAMGVWMQREIAGPGVEHGGDPELSAEPLGITPE
jgi:hypothetical protein